MTSMIRLDLGTESGGATATITIDRPDRRNALNADALDQLDDHLDQIHADAAVRCVVLTGTDGHFCSGADLKEIEDLRFTEHLRRVLDRLEALPVPLIASIDGSCMGLGVQLALTADIRIARASARFAVPVAKLGLMVDQWTIRRASALLGASTARYMMLSAAVVTADDAFRLGFVNEIAGPDRVTELADSIAALAPLTIAGTKYGLVTADRGDLVGEDGWDPRYRAAFERAWSSDDLVEGRSAFGERRPPVFRGR